MRGRPLPFDMIPPPYTTAGSRNPFHRQRTVGKRNPRISTWLRDFYRFAPRRLK